nr:JAB domain-containing protein [Acetobacter persici]
MKSQKMAQFHDIINLPWLIHNHPSGDPSPSQDDILMTQRITQAASLLGVTVWDHIIIGSGRLCSLKEDGFF